ncbi:MAG: CDP-diacylglycerol--serine O-phosphatidyltransferase [Saprospiraceae bacterium]|jgi:CDP-diacylglycerol--serine O-phosphatidyltransferase
MSKLPEENRFLDLSDYGRPAARFIANSIKETSLTPIHVTIAFIISGLIAIYCMLEGYYILAAFFLVLKSILDAADGELARIKATPSYVGRYFDSIADIILNLLFLITIWHITDGSLALLILAFLGIQLQGTLYNYYYVILRNIHNGDTTSRVFEDHAPVALPGETQRAVNLFFWIYNTLYITFDKTIYYLDMRAASAKNFPNWFMTAVSAFGLGFQLLIMGIMLIFHLENYIISFFMGYTLLIFVFIGIRRIIND